MPPVGNDGATSAVNLACHAHWHATPSCAGRPVCRLRTHVVASPVSRPCHHRQPAVQYQGATGPVRVASMTRALGQRKCCTRRALALVRPWARAATCDFIDQCPHRMASRPWPDWPTVCATPPHEMVLSYATKSSLRSDYR